MTDLERLELILKRVAIRLPCATLTEIISELEDHNQEATMEELHMQGIKEDQ